MNPQRVHRLMRQHFPEIDAVRHEWINVADQHGVRREILESMLQAWLDAPYLLVQVHRRLGDYLPREAALDFICQHVGAGWGGYMRVTDREFSAFVVIATNGVASAWRP